jgi:hypothetical protein
LLAQHGKLAVRHGHAPLLVGHEIAVNNGRDLLHLSAA